MPRKAKKKVAASAATRNKKNGKAIAVKSVKAQNPAAKKATRRSAADVARLRKAVIAGLRSGKTAVAVALQLGISRPYLYRVKRGG
ncbi:hypothetical protein [Aestuariivirga sp.]|uniref:hypothetical protein n=1 Tax=Aestuariivirga sp. TaxID=2650926 RepID=UPI0025BA4E09|nr:hypothetical protein [Aestuariivirga sp.]MCA3556019.1 hypothetical protein [Aestuariivirga sp.]